MFRELLQKLGSRTAQKPEGEDDASQSQSRERVTSYGSVSGKGRRVSASSPKVKDKIEKSLS